MLLRLKQAKNDCRSVSISVELDRQTFRSNEFLEKLIYEDPLNFHVVSRYAWPAFRTVEFSALGSCDGPRSAS